MSIDDKLSQIFGVEPQKQEFEVITREGQVLPPKNEALDYDYEKTRGNLHTLLQQGQDALFHALEVAKQSEHPRAFEVVGNLMKNLSDINHQLLDLHAKKQTLEAPAKKEESAKSVTNNSIFVGSTAELSKLVNDMRKD